ncbi:cytochrome b-c1 complex subunit Rieske [Colletotrichum tofieldiae]|nr:cytochrome b-c1 complex subunit Rieske [Colletotrichum tofieldiae]GKT70356.1 cytochrome b-c1 complex subunit Rieske [Colletotrichum tofieldiae]
MAPLAHASRTCLRQLARSSPSATTAARALSTSAARNDSTATSYSSPFTGAQAGNKIPDFSKYMSKTNPGTNQLFGYFMVGTMGAITAAGAKSTVQGREIHPLTRERTPEMRKMDHQRGG